MISAPAITAYLQEEEQMLAEYREGASIESVARKYGYSVERLSALLNRKGIPKRGPIPFRPTEEQVAEIMRLISGPARLSAPDIGVRYGVSKATINRVVAKYRAQKKKEQSS